MLQALPLKTDFPSAQEAKQKIHDSYEGKEKNSHFLMPHDHKYTNRFHTLAHINRRLSSMQSERNFSSFGFLLRKKFNIWKRREKLFIAIPPPFVY
jgi:hypothetical protein